MSPVCTPVGFICVAPPFAAVAEADYALRVPSSPPPGPRIDPAEAERLGVRISDFSSDLVRSAEATPRNRRCVDRACVLVDRVIAEAPTDLYFSWGASTSDDPYVRVYRSVSIKAVSVAAREAAVAAVSLQTGKAGVYVPLKAMLKQLGR